MPDLRTKRRIALITFITIAAAGSACPKAAAAADPAPQGAEESKAARDKRMAWWREAKFGMFIHWGLYAIPAGEWNGKQVGGIGEWIMHNARIPVSQYQQLARQFNPVKFDADEWVMLAKDAGMKYMVITSKHHDGFAMFGSKASKYNIVDATPFKRDPLKELAAACKKHGIKLGFYYSQAQDWAHPGGAGNNWDREMPRVSMEQYIREKAAPQVRELLTSYGDVAILWWDTPANMTRQRADMLRPLVKLQPNIITNNRLGGGSGGDYDTPEQRIPASAKPGQDWETCMTMNNTWGFKKYDNNWKSTADLIHKLADIAGKGGNFLLNVGPTAEGVIPEPSVKHLREMGRWMKVNGESIYGTTAGPLEALPWGVCTAKPGRLYLHVFNWPADKRLAVPGLTAVSKAYLLADAGRKALIVKQEAKSAVVGVPENAPDPHDSVIVLELGD
jgi:alpha-L-fucosidase